MGTTTKIAVIFDIDGTLVESSGFEDDLYVAAVRDVLGDVCIRKAWNTYRHVTDTGILKTFLNARHSWNCCMPGNGVAPC